LLAFGTRLVVVARLSAALIVTQLAITTVVVVFTHTRVATATLANATAFDTPLALIALAVIDAVWLRVATVLRLATSVLAAKAIAALAIVATALAFTATVLASPTLADLALVAVGCFSAATLRRLRDTATLTAL
jgi:hypothetical protein